MIFQLNLAARRDGVYLDSQLSLSSKVQSVKESEALGAVPEFPTNMGIIHVPVATLVSENWALILLGKVVFAPDLSLGALTSLFLRRPIRERQELRSVQTRPKYI